MAELEEVVAKLQEDPATEQIASEISVLQSIYGDDALSLWKLPSQSTNKKDETVRYSVTLGLPDPHEQVTFSALVSLPPSYPSSAPPQLQLLSRYIGAFGVSSAIFGSVLRTFISANDGVGWTPETVCVFDGLENVREKCGTWYRERLSEMVREETSLGPGDTPILPEDDSSTQFTVSEPQDSVELPEGLEIIEAEPIVDRKSSFVGRACRITSPDQVPLVISYLLSDRRIARAAHPVIHAWRCQVGNVIHQDNDDDGETAAGGRMAHLLQILGVNNVLVVVTRYFGGTLLGADRFKHINQAARNALDAGGFLDALPSDDKKSRKRK
ncbi:ribosomal protein S5 domain 2-type protein [Thelephora terrestris]|uniref:Ribosomal protein S5 domain 2-type protein n=1 Tax=Thelephora terrestris TaxID=56493 RepID=A0A9P6H6H8_9AGAM|nr:ribosomal protein S5 domain 2-type protein [Thelephora terrestris]